LPIAGVIWYQGESNALPERAPTYAAMFGAMIRDWRRAGQHPPSQQAGSGAEVGACGASHRLWGKAGVLWPSLPHSSA
jgi:hypothetical protein